MLPYAMLLANHAEVPSYLKRPNSISSTNARNHRATQQCIEEFNPSTSASLVQIALQCDFLQVQCEEWEGR